MDRIGVYLELKDGNVKPTNFELLTLVQQAGREVTGIMFGDDPASVLAGVAEYRVNELVHVGGLGGDGYKPEVWAAHLADVIRERGLGDCLATCSAQGRDLFSRVAARLEAALVNDCTSVDLEARTATKPMYGGKVIARIRMTSDCRLYTLRPNSIIPAPAGGGGAPEVIPLKAGTVASGIEIREIVKDIADKIDLTEAKIIISGGRGMGSAESFAVLQKLAESLGAALGASRAAVDAGYATQDMQVGQTGKTVNPVLYIACGISGAVQHFAGMKTSKVIVAVNKDPEAPIFEKADYGIVGDVFEVVPLLTEEFGRALSE